MRLWHYELIPVLPKQMLVSQWRECIAIKRQWEKGTLKHRLVSYVKDYDKCYFLSYVIRLVLEMQSRKIKYKEQYYYEIVEFCKTIKPLYDFVDYPEHNHRYFRQCIFNLEEKFDRGIITKDEYKKIIELELQNMAKESE